MGAATVPAPPRAPQLRRQPVRPPPGMGQSQREDLPFQLGRRPARRLGWAALPEAQGVQAPALHGLAPAVIRRVRAVLANLSGLPTSRVKSNVCEIAIPRQRKGGGQKSRCGSLDVLALSTEPCAPSEDGFGTMHPVDHLPNSPPDVRRIRLQRIGNFAYTDPSHQKP